MSQYSDLHTMKPPAVERLVSRAEEVNILNNRKKYYIKDALMNQKDDQSSRNSWQYVCKIYTL